MKTTIRNARNALTLLVCAAFFTTLFLLQATTAQAQWTTPNAQNNISNTNSGNVGVGTTTPNYKFDINSMLDKAQIRFGIGEADWGGYLYSGHPSHAILAGGAGYNDGWIAKSLSASMFEASLGQLMFYTNGGLSTGSGFTPTPRMIITSGGNVGIGTLTPQDPLHIFSTLNSVGTMRLQGGSTYAAFLGMWNAGQMFILSNNRHPGTGSNFNTAVAGAQIAVGAASAPGDIAFFTTSSGLTGTGLELMRIKSNGNIGINTTNPGYKLDVQGGQINSSGGLCIAGDCKTSWSSVGGSQWANGASSSINYAAGNVGIGTITPTQKLEINGAALVGTVYGSSAASGTLTLQSTSSTTKGAINIGVDQTTTTNIAQSGTPGNKLIVATDRLIVNNAGVRVNGASDHGDLSATKLNLVNSDALQFRTTNPNIQSNGSLLFTAQNVGGDNVRFNVQNNAVSNAFVIESNTATPARLFDVRNLGSSQFTIAGSGNVGIGTTSPSTKLHVVGDVTVTGNIAAKYQDVAEWVDSPQELAPGTVVVLHEEKSNQVIASTQSYDSRVAGVISLQPGLTLGEAGEGRVLVATTGRVKVRVDATSGPIKIGDLLVTSNVEGVAMKSVPVDVAGGVRMHRPGTLIGKALEPLAGGKGEILVLLSLQ